MKYTNKNHVFVVMAYKESEYLEKCILSLKNQTIAANIFVSTSTPNAYITEIANRNGLQVVVNTGAHGIAEDWNFAYQQGKKNYDLVTLAHQDDIYESTYLETILDLVNEYNDTTIAFSDYYEIINDRKVLSDHSLNLKIKKILLYPLRFKHLQNKKWVCRRVLSLGNPICCPAVTYVVKNLPQELFVPHFKSNVDWETWERITKLGGRFLYIPQLMMGHRIHESSTTAEVIGNGDGRKKEDMDMICRFWPKPIARIIGNFYAIGQKENIQ